MNAAKQRNWKEILFSRRMVTCVFIGFTSGMPLYVLIQLVPAWLRSNDVDLATIGTRVCEATILRRELNSRATTDGGRHSRRRPEPRP